MKKIVAGVLIGLAGAALVVAAIKFSFLNWVVDLPAWLVRQFTPINFHEGEGAFGFFLAILLSWVFSTSMIWVLAVAARYMLA